MDGPTERRRPTPQAAAAPSLPGRVARGVKGADGVDHRRQVAARGGEQEAQGRGGREVWSARRRAHAPSGASNTPARAAASWRQARRAGGRLTRWAPLPRAPASPPPAPGSCCSRPRSSACNGVDSVDQKTSGAPKTGTQVRCCLPAANQPAHSRRRRSLRQAVNQARLQLAAGVGVVDGHAPGPAVGGRLAGVQLRHAHHALGGGAVAHQRRALACIGWVDGVRQGRGRR